MSQLVFKNAKVLFGGCDLSANLNQVDCTVGAKMVDDNVFGDTSESYVAGLISTSIDVTGYWDAVLTGNPDGADNTLFPAVGVDDKLISVFPDGYTEGTLTDQGIGLLSTLASYTPINGKHGELLGLKAKAAARGLPLRAIPLKNSTTAFAGTGTGTKFNIGNLSASQYLYAGLHVIGYTGTAPTLDMLIQSDTDASAGGEVTRITFAQVGQATGGFYATRLAGPVTAPWWWAKWTVGGSASPGYKFLVWMAIGA